MKEKYTLHTLAKMNYKMPHRNHNNKNKLKIAVHLHVFYTDLIPSIRKSLCNIPEPFDLYVSIPETIDFDFHGIKDTLAELENVKELVIEKVPNRGRDIAPMLCTFKERLSSYDVFLHLHTKKSPHNNALSGWFPYICRHLLPPHRTKVILDLLSRDVGMIVPPNYICDPSPDGWGRGNIEIAQQIINRSGLDIDLRSRYPSIDYPQGSMFWARTDFLRPLFDIPFTYEEFPKEPIGVDGTIAHALERLFFIWGTESRLDVYREFDKEDIERIQKKYDELLNKNKILSEKNEKHLKTIRWLIVFFCLLVLTAIFLFSVLLF